MESEELLTVALACLPTANDGIEDAVTVHESQLMYPSALFNDFI